MLQHNKTHWGRIFIILMLVMALCGNAILSLLYGLEADRLGEHGAYWLLIPCFVYMIFYAVYGHKILRWHHEK